MKFNHLNLTVLDPATNADFFETYFGMKCVVKRGRNAFALLVDGSGFVLSLNNFDKLEKVEYPAGFHVGFMQESREQVDAIHERLKAGGFDVPAPREFHGAWTFYFEAPGGFTVEVQHLHGHDVGQAVPVG